MSTKVPVRKALDQAVAAAQRPAVPVSAGEPGAVWELDPVLQAAQITVRLPTTIQRLTAATDRSLHSIPGGSGCADTGRVLGIPVRRESATSFRGDGDGP